MTGPELLNPCGPTLLPSNSHFSTLRWSLSHKVTICHVCIFLHTPFGWTAWAVTLGFI